MNSKAQRKNLAIEFAGRPFILRHDGSVYLPATQALLVADLHLGKEESFRCQSIPVPEGPTSKTLSLLSASLEEVKPKRLLILGDLIHDANSMSRRLLDEFAFWRTRHQSVDVVLVRGNHDRYVRRFPAEWELKEVDFERVDSVVASPQTFGSTHTSPAAQGGSSTRSGQATQASPTTDQSGPFDQSFEQDESYDKNANGPIEPRSRTDRTSRSSIPSLFLVHEAVEANGSGRLLEMQRQSLAEPDLSREAYFVEGHWHPVVRIGIGADQIRVRCFCIRERTMTLPAFGPFKGGHPISVRDSTVYPLIEGHILAPPDG